MKVLEVSNDLCSRYRQDVLFKSRKEKRAENQQFVTVRRDVLGLVLSIKFNTWKARVENLRKAHVLLRRIFCRKWFNMKNSGEYSVQFFWKWDFIDIYLYNSVHPLFIFIYKKHDYYLVLAVESKRNHKQILQLTTKK